MSTTPRSLDEQILRAVLDQSPSCIIIAEAPSGRIVYLNEAARRFRGPTTAKLTDITIAEYAGAWKDLFPDGTPMKPEQMPLARAFMKGEVIENEEVIVELDNCDRRWALASAAPVLDLDGRICGAVVIWSDVTELKRTQRLLSEAQKENRRLHDFLPTCSHCQRIRNDSGDWFDLQTYVTNETDSQFSHGICPDCIKKYHPDLVDPETGDLA